MEEIQNEYINIINLTDDASVIKKIIKQGEGDLPINGQNIIAHYTGKLEDGTVFDSSLNRDEPFNFILGEGSVIKSWDLCFASMKRGEKALLETCPEFAYGESGSPPSIPANSKLFFEVELLDYHDKEKELWEMNNDEKKEKALYYKNIGKELFEKKEFKHSEQAYDQGLNFIKDIDDDEDINLLKVQLNLNCSIASAKNNEWKLSSWYANQAIIIDNDNIKALYRQAVAEQKLWNMDKSNELYNRILEIDENNKLAKVQLNNNLIISKKQNQKEKDFFSKAFL